MDLKIAQQISFHIPPFTFADQAHGYQLAVAALRLGAGSFEKWRQLQADIVNNADRAIPKSPVVESAGSDVASSSGAGTSDEYHVVAGI